MDYTDCECQQVRDIRVDNRSVLLFCDILFKYYMDNEVNERVSQLYKPKTIAGFTQ